MSAPAGYLEINRRFGPLHSSGRPEELASSSYLRSLGADFRTLGWDDLLKQTLVVVLGEPGSGKSWELRWQCASIQRGGGRAFLIELERLVSADVVSVLAADHERFQQWRRGTDVAHFFLDSVDEAKIRRHSDFYTAFEKMLTAIGPAGIDRTRLIISSRISEWQPETDRHEVLSRLLAHRGSHPDESRKSEEKLPSVLVVQIEPLDRDRVRRFAEGRGINDPGQFLTALDTHFAWDFARRPLDVIDLAEFWKAHGRLGSLTEIIEHDVATKLRETTQRQTTFVLSEARAREGAEALAVATVLCKQQHFKVPDDTFLAPDALDAASCLPADWKPAEVAALLSRPLFDSAIYGQIRFHHRRVSEYLAAQWLKRRMSEGCPLHVLRQLLFDDRGAISVPRRALVPVIAWLCSGNDRWNAEVRNWVRSAAPEVHLEHGDAEGLPLEFRRDLLRSWIDRNRGREEVRTRYTPDALRRLACPQLAPDIAAFLSKTTTPRDIRELLVQFVRFGALTTCLPNLITILRTPGEPDDLKEYVLAALRDVGTPESRQQAWDILRGYPTLTNQMRLLACQTLYPRTIGAAEVAVLLEKPGPRHEDHSSLQHAFGELLEEELPAENAGALLVELNRILQAQPHIFMSEKETRISARFEFYLEVLPLILTRLLSGVALDESRCLAAAESLSLLAEADPFHRHRNDYYESLDDMTKAHPGVRRCFFRRCVARWRTEHPKDANCFFVTHEFNCVLHLAEADLSWMIEDIESNSSHADRRPVLYATLRLLRNRRDPRIDRLQRAVRKDAELSAEVAAARAGDRWGWLRRFRYRWGSAYEWKYWWLRKRNAASWKWRACREWWRLLRYRHRLRSGRAVPALAGLTQEARGDQTKYTSLDWERLAAKRGAGVARAVKSGCKRVWREFTPLLPHEKPWPNEVDRGVVAGLVGIQSMFTDGEHSFGSLSDADARLITRYAVHEMNGFPDWFPDLVAAKPAAVADVVRQCVLGEWQYPPDREHCYDVLAHLAWENGCLSRLVRTTVVELLGTGDPANHSIRDYALSLAVSTSIPPDTELGAIAAARCRVLDVGSDGFGMWLAVCLQFDAGQAVSILEERLADCSTAADVVLQVCALLGDEMRPRVPRLVRPDYLNPPALARLIVLVYRHVRPEDDIDRTRTGPYTPTDRDAASRFRGALVARLAQAEGPEVLGLLRSLLTHSELARHYDWIRHLLDERFVTDADILAWSPAAIREFAREYETTPRTDAELFQITVNRIADVKNDVENSDNSLREEIRKNDSEYVLRRWLARKLNERSRQRYTVPQEEEIDQKVRPDLRTETPHTAPVSIELKWADNWTLPQLLERLENQLLGQYLRAERNRYGVYVLATDGRKRHWEVTGSADAAFDEVVDRVALRAQELVTLHPEIGDMRVVGIDFRPPPER